MAFVPDMRGVWRELGTLEITEKPTKPARTMRAIRSSRSLADMG